MNPCKTVEILKVPVAVVNMMDFLRHLESFLNTEGPSEYITVTGVHGIMESERDAEIARAHRNAWMCVPDGMPTVWIGRYYGHLSMGRVCGPDMMLEAMKNLSCSHFLFGGGDGVVERLKSSLENRFDKVKITGTYTPPFREMNGEEFNNLAGLLKDQHPDIIWVGLSTPKQELWMMRNIHRLTCRLMIGVGAAFDFNAGLIKRAPRWMQQIGLEWLYRLIVEPRRLWKRYMINNPLFIGLILLQFLGLRKPEIEKKRI